MPTRRLETSTIRPDWVTRPVSLIARRILETGLPARAFVCGRPPATREFSLSNSGRRVKRFRVSGLSMRRIDGCRRPAWRCADRVCIAFARSEAPRRPAGFPDPVSTAVRPCTVLGLSRVSGGADLRLDCSNGRRTPEELLIHFFIHSRSPDRRPSPGRTRELCSIPSSSRRPRPSAPSCSPAPPRPASAVSSSAARPAKDRRFHAAMPIG